MRIWYMLALVGGLVPAAAFIVLYAQVPGWWGTPIGRNLMAKAATLSGVYLLSLIAMLLPIPAWVWLSCTAVLDAVLWWRLAILWRIRHHDDPGSLIATSRRPGSTGDRPPRRGIMSIRDILLGAWKTFVIGTTGAIVLWLANRGIHLPAGWDGLLESLLLGAGLSAYNTVVNWLQSRSGKGVLSFLAHWLGRLLVLGVKAVPSYPAAGQAR